MSAIERLINDVRFCSGSCSTNATPDEARDELAILQAAQRERDELRARVVSADYRPGDILTYELHGLLLEVTFVEDVEGWCLVQCSDSSQVIARPSRLSRATLANKGDGDVGHN